jgi:glycosyltransferase involved in cell wall biosynthesis
LRICFIDRSTKLETVNDLETRARGGMVTSLFKVSDYLSRQGHDVWVLGDVKVSGLTESGTKWINKESETTGDNRYIFDESFDFLICNRGVHDGYPEVRAKHRVLWTHDLPHSGFIPEPRTIKAFSATVFMSQYAERIWRAFYKDIGKSFYIPNGVDKEIFYPGTDKSYNNFFFESAHNRGLKRLPFIFDSIRARVGRYVYMDAYSNLSKLHPNEGEDTFSDVYNEVARSEVELHDPIPQSELADQLRKASLMILPTDYPEICSNIVLQALACGVPVVTTGNLGSACEVLKHGKNGMLTEFQPHDYMIYQLEMIRNAVTVLEDSKLHNLLIRNAADTKIYSWDQIGAQWNKMLEKFI